MRSLTVRFIWIFALVFALALNTLAIVLPINGMSTEQLSDNYPSPFTPIGFTFSIWSVIYSALIIMAVYQFFSKQNSALAQSDKWIISNLFANAAWILAWHYEFLWVALAIMLFLLFTLFKVYQAIESYRFELGKVARYLIKVPISLYIGWISVATLANISILQTAYQADNVWLGFEMWTFIKLSVAGTLAIAMIFKKDYVYASVIIWAAFGISQNHVSGSAINTAASFLMMLILFVAVYRIGASAVLTLKKYRT